jgi:ubiquitin C-terminal hydrolase
LLLAAAEEETSAKKPARASAARAWTGTSPARIPTPHVRTADVATYQRTPVTSARHGRRTAEQHATKAARTPVELQRRRMSFAPASPATHTVATRPIPPKEANHTRKGALASNAASEGTETSTRLGAETNANTNANKAKRAPDANAQQESANAGVSAPLAGKVSPRALGTKGTTNDTGPKTHHANWWEKTREPSENKRKAEEDSSAPASKNDEETEKSEAPDFGPPRASNPFAAAAAAAASKRATAVASTTPHVSPHPTANPTRVPGFTNLGNTCYLAATTQLLLGVPAFVDELAGLVAGVCENDGTKGVSSNHGTVSRPTSTELFPDDSVMRAVLGLLTRRADAARAFDAGIPNARASLAPHALKRAAQTRRMRYNGFAQHDAHEFLVDTLDLMEEDLQTACYGNNKKGIVPLHRTVCPTRRAFTGASRVTLTCALCGDVSYSTESWRHLSLELSAGESREGPVGGSPLPLQALLQRCFAPETVERRCAKNTCGGRHASLTRQVLRAPKTLLVHLKRFRAAAQVLPTAATTATGAPLVSPNEPRVGADCVEPPSAPLFALPRMIKDGQRVELPEFVSLVHFASQDVRGPPVVSSLSTSTSTETDTETDDASAATAAYADDASTRGDDALSRIGRYKLRGLVSHLGSSMRSGHYTSTVRMDAGQEADEKKKDAYAKEKENWVAFDDSFAAPVGSPVSKRGETRTERDWYVAAFECAR